MHGEKRQVRGLVHEALRRLGDRRSKASRAVLIVDQFACSHSTSAQTGFMKALPSAVSSYSTRGGTSGYTSRVNRPSRSRLRRVAVNIRCEMPGIDRLSVENRLR